MAKKVHKKPRHTQLVVPGSDKEKKKREVPARDRMGRVAPEATVYRAAPKTAEMPEAAGAAAATTGVADAKSTTGEKSASAAQGGGNVQQKAQEKAPVAEVGKEAQAKTAPRVPAPAKARPIGPTDVEGDGVELLGMPPRQAEPPKPPAGAPAQKKPQTAPKGFGGFFKRSKKTGASPGGAKEPKSAPKGRSEADEEPLPANAIAMPRKNPRVAAVRRKKRWRRIRVLVVLLLLASGVLFYVSGLYVSVSMKAGEAFESLRIRMQPGDGFPMPFTMSGFIKAEEMGEAGFAALGSADMAIVSATGKELRRVQHGYVDPGMSAGDTRVCVYNRGGKEYAVEGREKRVAYRTTQQDILFVEMSPGGWLALFTESSVQVYNPQYDDSEPDFKMTLQDEAAVVAAFHTDNRSLAVGCLSTREGALGTTLYLLRTDRTDIQAKVRVDGAVALQLHYNENGELLAVFDKFTILYAKDGTELARYDYGGRQLMAADHYAGQTALCFGSQAQEKAELVVLDTALLPLFSAAVEASGTPRPLVSELGAYLLVGNEVLAYTFTGALAGTQVLEATPYGLVRGGQPLAVTAAEVLPLADMLAVEAESGASA